MMPKSRLKVSALRRTLTAIKPHLSGQKLMIGGGLAALFAEVLFRILEPWPVKIVVDAVTRSLGADLGAPGPAASLSLLLACGLAVVALTGARALSNYLSTVAFALVGSRVATDLRARVFRHVQGLSMRYHARSSRGDTVQRLIGDISRLQEVAVTAGLPLIANVVTLLAMSAVMFWLDPLLTVVLLVAALSFWLISHRSAGAITAAARSTRKGEGSLATTAQEALGAMRVVQAYGLEDAVSRRFSASNGITLTEGVKSRRLAAALERRTDVIVGIATAVVLTGGGWRVSTGEMTPGDLVIFMTYLKTAMKPMRDLAKYIGRIARASASGERVADLLDEAPDIEDRPDARAARNVRGRLTFEGVTAEYIDGQRVLDGLNLDIRPGQRIALVGPSGGGKSTLAALAIRLLDPAEGCVRLDGTDVRELTLSSLRGQVSIILQDSILFAESVRENIRFGRLDADDEQVERAAELAQAAGFIRDLEHGYDTVLGEGGDTLSGGQRQRIAVARALLRDAPIVILDEATSGLDPLAKGKVLAALSELTSTRTTLSITHDAVTALDSDLVVWIDGGRVLEQGRPQDLARRPGSLFAGWLADHDPAHRQMAEQP
ncbi:ABC transporter ATP-binding protein [Saxibacter everestensis]|uniref:ABC transporter ATP-binding protein n=1 Tax=Saxibacter everestensis TaxID=2909229 RepID=A0ABY8QX17_9MICO|nr:ABC transporter ATP-binding protein [Brevibacteriaceae bacterium ZFBP1038]